MNQILICILSCKKLIEEFRAIDNSQLFIISHNDRFLNEVQDGELYLLMIKENREEE